ncbi:YaaR family protein [Pelotomaculum terephthalicicum JT]|uniref:YaaR family protein n=1 Tax=Pelotomaculum terephthalicicum TaxID=206393 RepID=UPI001F049DB4|nr:YaaR family protein [Pelotomaculum terephthalicicum]MCG9966836.1 YaaR family protein [Pelotomaculum terephthalicicum JT]
MKISSVDRSPGRKYKPTVLKAGDGKDFSSTLDMAKREQRKLEEMLDKIKAAGEKLKRTKSKADVIEYKNQIQEYLSFVLEKYYRVKQDYGLGRLLIRIEIINEKIDELTASLLEQQKANLEIAGKIDEIAGLLLDLYN